MKIKDLRDKVLRVSTAAVAVAVAALLAPRASLAQFPGEGVDVFASSSSLCVVIDGFSYGSLIKAVDPGTLVGRSNVFIEGTAPDISGIHVPITGCPQCDSTVSDSDLTCFPPAAPETGVEREVHTEMLDLHLCHACNICPCAGAPPVKCDEICYLAGQSAWDALVSVGRQDLYQNSYGEVESQNSAGNPAADFPATSFFDIKGVITITTGGTTNVFVLSDSTNSILMVNGMLGAFPPAPGNEYSITAGTKLPGGGGGACSVCNISIMNAVDGNPANPDGFLCCPVHHDAEPPPPEGPGCATIEVAGDGSVSTSERAPNSNFRFGRAVYLIPRSEMVADRIRVGSQIHAIGWRHAVAGTPANGTLQIYLENTSDTTNNKSTTWSTAISGMTLVHNSSTTIPAQTTYFDIPFSGGASFNYTGDAVYVAFDWQWPGPAGTGAQVACDTRLTGGLKGANNATTPPTTIAASNFRPETRLTPTTSLASNASVDLVRSLGALPNGIASPHVVTAVATNRGSFGTSGVPVTLNVSGAETFSDTQVTPPLAACGGQAVVTFAPFAASTLGTDSVAVSVPDDARTVDDSRAKRLDVNPNRYAYKQAGSTPFGGIGFNGTNGQVAVKLPLAVATQINALTLEFSVASAATYSIAIYGDSGSGTPGSILYTEATARPVSAAGPVTVRTIVPVNAGPGTIFAAVRQTNTTNMGLSFDPESPVRTGTFFYTDNLSSSGPWTDFAPDAPFKPNVGIIVGSCLVPMSVDVTPNGATPACAGGTGVTFTANSAGGTGNLTYQWTQNDIDISGATASIQLIQESSSGQVFYNSKVTDDGGCTNVQDPTYPSVVWGTNGASCTDNNPCTSGELCSNTVCSGGSPVPTPGEALNLQIAPNKSSVTWTPVPNATLYDLLRGNENFLPVGPGGGDETCFPNLPSASFNDGSSPGPAETFYYIVRAKNDCAAGTYGTETGGAQRLSTTCP